jgi:hypothetical protein
MGRTVDDRAVVGHIDVRRDVEAASHHTAGARQADLATAPRMAVSSRRSTSRWTGSSADSMNEVCRLFELWLAHIRCSCGSDGSPGFSGEISLTAT